MRWEYGSARPVTDDLRVRNCVGPQNGEPRCPCMMPDYRRREAGGKLLDMLMRGELIRKPRVRVKAGSARA